MHIKRELEKIISDRLVSGKVNVLFGARRVGKTYLINQICQKLSDNYLLLNGEDFVTQDLLITRSIQNYKNLLGDKKILIIDEAQKIPSIGDILKLIVDSFPQLIIFVSGSSAFDMNNLIGEPLTGRKISHKMFSLSESELSAIENVIQKKDNLKLRLIYGNYPELISIADLYRKAQYLKEIINSYLLKDILEFDKIKNSNKIFNLLRLIAYQVGNIVSYREIGTQLSMNKITVERYLDLLAKVFVLHKVTGYSRNLRKEIVKNPKWYFYDNGIMNAIISNFNPIENRDDIGALWENYMISERLKYQHYNSIISNNYFWRTYDRQEIDWLEEREGNLFAYEFKWKKVKSKIPKAFAGAYPDAEFLTVTNEDYSEFLGLA